MYTKRRNAASSLIAQTPRKNAENTSPGFPHYAQKQGERIRRLNKLDVEGVGATGSQCGEKEDLG